MSMPTAIVTGDVNLDRNIYGGIKMEPGSPLEPGTVEASPQLGGAALCHKIMAAAAAVSQGAVQSVLGVEESGLAEKLAQTGHLCSFSIWTPQLGKGGGKQDAPKVWRQSTNLGYGARKLLNEQARAWLVRSKDMPDSPTVILVDDRGISFRHQAAREAWPDFASASPADDMLPSIVLKMETPLCRGELWSHLSSTSKLAQRLLVIVSAEDLRREDAQIRQHLSWEQTAADAMRALHEHPLASDLRKAAHIIVTFRSAGALWLYREQPGGDHAARLIFDPHGLEGDFERGFQGRVPGARSVFAAAVAHYLLMARTAAEASSDVVRAGIIAGLQARRRLLENGHGVVGAQAGFPYDDIGKHIAGSHGGYATTTVPAPSKLAEACQWSILAQTEDPFSARSNSHLGLGLWTARYGRPALSHAPCLAMGNQLFTADRSEIESLRTLERLMRDYQDAGPQQKPLSIGVFGPPGAGKSFGVKALARAILGDKAPILEFNLSQFKDAAELVGAFHRVRDEVLKGITPVAFWDEFDSQGYKWLQYLLAPMQDGAFQEGQITHPIGKCVFVFAGGTADTAEEFGVQAPKELSTEERGKIAGVEREDRLAEEAVYREFRLLKGPDFMSRLHGFLNVLGPNPRKSRGESSSPDLTWPVRRALMLRGVLGLQDRAGYSEPLDMDAGLLIALLGVPHYTHGSRSFEKILLALKQGRMGGHYHRSALLPDALLARETDVGAFHRLLHLTDPFQTNPNIEAIAAAIHANYLSNAKAQGWAVKPELNKSYEELAPDYKSSNQAAARRIPELLSFISFRVVRNEKPDDLSWKPQLQAQIAAHRDRLAEAEHLGWHAERIATGWTHSPQRDDVRKLHNLLVPWVQLSEQDKDKDRENMDAIPTWLQLAGYKAERVPQSGGE